MAADTGPLGMAAGILGKTVRGVFGLMSLALVVLVPTAVLTLVWAAVFVVVGQYVPLPVLGEALLTSFGVPATTDGVPVVYPVVAAFLTTLGLLLLAGGSSGRSYRRSHSRSDGRGGGGPD